MRYSITKLFPVMFCFLLNNGFGQQTGNNKTDSSKIIYMRHTSNYPRFPPLYIIDDQKNPDSLANSDQAFKRINPNGILAISILKDAEANAIYGSKGAHGVVIITTKAYAKAKYQEKLSTFSKKYKSYMEHHQNNDENIGYIVNAIFLSVKSAQRIQDLYEIPNIKIKTVDFIENQFYNGGDSRPYIVIITTKQ